MTEREERAKEWLNRNYGLALEVESIKRRLEKMQSDIEKVCKPIKPREVQEGRGGNSQEDKMADYIDMTEELKERLSVLLAKDRETIRVIEKVESPILRTILNERYINRLKWQKIAVVVHLEQSRLFDYHRQALSAILPYIPEEDKK